MKVRRILVAHDFSEPADRALRFAAKLAKPLAAELHVVHVVTQGAEVAVGASHTADQRERYARFLDQELEHVVSLVSPELTAVVTRHVVEGDPSEQIPQLAATIEADILCIGSTGKGAVQRALLGTVSQRIVRTSTLPVLTTH